MFRKSNDFGEILEYKKKHVQTCGKSCLLRSAKQFEKKFFISCLLFDVCHHFDFYVIFRLNPFLRYFKLDF